MPRDWCVFYMFLLITEFSKLITWLEQFSNQKKKKYKTISDKCRCEQNIQKQRTSMGEMFFSLKYISILLSSSWDKTTTTKKKSRKLSVVMYSKGMSFHWNSFFFLFVCWNCLHIWIGIFLYHCMYTRIYTNKASPI